MDVFLMKRNKEGSVSITSLPDHLATTAWIPGSEGMASIGKIAELSSPESKGPGDLVERGDIQDKEAA